MPDVMVRLSPEMAALLQRGWSPPVRVQIERLRDGTYTMIAKTHICPKEEDPS